MTEVVQEKEKFFRRSGDPYRVQICRLDDPEVNFFKRFTKSAGLKAYEHHDWMCADVFGDGLSFRAKDASFRPVPDGLYVFYKDEKEIWYCKGPM